MLNGERLVIYGDGEQSRDFTFIDNAIKANILAAESDVTGEAFNVGTGGRITINELVDDGVLEEVTGQGRNKEYRAREIFEILEQPPQTAVPV